VENVEDSKKAKDETKRVFVGDTRDIRHTGMSAPPTDGGPPIELVYEVAQVTIYPSSPSVLYGLGRVDFDGVSNTTPDEITVTFFASMNDPIGQHDGTDALKPGALWKVRLTEDYKLVDLQPVEEASERNHGRSPAPSSVVGQSVIPKA